MGIRFNFKIALSLLFLFSGNAVVAMKAPAMKPTLVGQELLKSVAHYIKALDLDLEKKVMDGTGTITPKSLAVVLDIEDFITLYEDAVEECYDFYALGLKNALISRSDAKKKLKARISVFNRAVTHPSRFSTLMYSELCSNACEAVRKLEEAKMTLVKKLRNLAKKIDATEVEDKNAEDHDAELKAKKDVFVEIINDEANRIERTVNERIEALRPSTRFAVWARATAYKTSKFVGEHKWWCIGGAAATVVTTGVLAYFMRNRLAALSFSNLPLLGSFFRPEQVVVPVTGLNPALIQPGPTV